MFSDRHGVDVFHRQWPHDEPKARVVIAHGASEHSGRYDRFARALNAAGYAASALDHRGHGRTTPSTGPGLMGPPGRQALVEDLDQLVDIAVADEPVAPIVAFGHSMGSLITLAYATEHADRLSAVVLSGFAMSIQGAEAMLATFRQAAEAAPSLDSPVDALAQLNAPFEPARTPFDWLSRDPDEVDKYVADPMCGNGNPLTLGFILDFVGLAAAAVSPDALSSVSCPVLLITGARDPAAQMGANADELEKALQAAGVDVTSLVYADARHELLNETNRDEVTADVIGWLDTTLS
jgi:alpha-beta hydrolase superfamily lysophospholipase